MQSIEKPPPVGAIDQSRAVDALAKQIADLSAQVGDMIRRIESTRATTDASSQYRNSPAALGEAVRRVYRDHGLTAREVEVCALLIRGYSDEEIARALGTQPGTIKSQVGRVCEKVNLNRKRICWDFFLRLSAGEDLRESQTIGEESPTSSKRHR
jgi:DNA-binding CsgD family transcriptional regulator